MNLGVQRRRVSAAIWVSFRRATCSGRPEMGFGRTEQRVGDSISWGALARRSRTLAWRIRRSRLQSSITRRRSCRLRRPPERPWFCPRRRTIPSPIHPLLFSSSPSNFSSNFWLLSFFFSHNWNIDGKNVVIVAGYKLQKQPICGWNYCKFFTCLAFKLQYQLHNLSILHVAKFI